MRFEESFNKFYKSLEERFDPEEEREKHYNTHIIKRKEMDFPNSIEYEKSADDMAKLEKSAKSAFDDKAWLVGYIDKNDRYYLYNRHTGEEVVYKYEGKFENPKEPTIITYYKPTKGMFEKIRDNVDIANGNDYTFAREFPHVEEQSKMDDEAVQSLWAKKFAAANQKLLDRQNKEEEERVRAEKEKKRNEYNQKMAKRIKKSNKKK